MHNDFGPTSRLGISIPENPKEMIAPVVLFFKLPSKLVHHLVLLQNLAQMVSGQATFSGSSRNIAGRFFHQTVEVLAFEFLEHQMLCRFVVRRWIDVEDGLLLSNRTGVHPRQEEIVALEKGPIRQRRRAFQNVFELANVSWPAVTLQFLQGIGRKLQRLVKS